MLFDFFSLDARELLILLMLCMLLIPVAIFPPSRLEARLRWTARLMGASFVGLVLVFFIGEGSFSPLGLRPGEAIQMTLFLITCAGLVIAWRWPLTGGALATGGALLFFAVELAATGRPPTGLVFYVMLWPGLLFLVDSFIRRRIHAE